MADEPPIRHVARAALKGELPPRYEEGWFDLLREHVEPRLVPGVRVLDVGSGATPTIAPGERPADCAYVGLDISEAELKKAPPGSYTDMVEADATMLVPELCDSFDVVVSWQVLEHVKPLPAAFENMRRYLRPGGLFVTQFSGAFSFHGIANRLLPQRAAVWMLKNLLGRPVESVFPAPYDKCWADAVERMLEPWSKAEVVPRWVGAGYLRFAKPAQAAYLAYEEWARRGGHDNLAPYYFVAAER